MKRRVKAVSFILLMLMFLGCRGKTGFAESLPEFTDMKKVPLMSRAELLEADPDFPSSYSIKGKGWMPPVKNQGSYGSCYAFAWTEAMESRLLQSGNHTRLSPWAFYDTFRGKEFTGSESLSIAAGIASGQAALVPEEEVPYPRDGSSETDCRQLTGRQDIVVHDIYYLDTITQNPFIDKKKLIKYYISQGYPVIATIPVESDDDFREDYMNSGTGAIFIPSEKPQAYHAVCIIGWSDSYDKGNFVHRPSVNGAWLCQNSWGPDWGDGGYCWISYQQTTLTDLRAVDIAGGADYRTRYQYDTRGWNYYDGKDSTTAAVNPGGDTMAHMMSRFTAESSGTVSAVGTYATKDDIDYLVYFSSGNSREKLLLDSGHIKTAGYHIIDLHSQVQVDAGAEFCIYLTLKSEKPAYLIPVDDYDHAYITTRREKGVSFVMKNLKWRDTAGEEFLVNRSGEILRANTCLKVFVK